MDAAKAGSRWINWVDILQLSYVQLFGTPKCILCANLYKCGSCKNQSEDTCDGVFDKNEDEVEITEDGLEYESEYSDNDWTTNNDCLV